MFRNTQFSLFFKRWFGVFAYRPIPGQCAVVLTDVAERKKIERALQESENRLRTLIRTIPDLIWLKDPDGVYLACNSRFESFFGAKERDIIGKTDYDFVDKKLADFFREHDRAAIAKGRASTNEEEITFASDRHREFLETIKAPIYSRDGKVEGVLGIGRDITARKKAEAERERLMAAIEQAGEMVVITDPNSGIQYVNPAFEQETGYRREEVIGQDPRIIQSGNEEQALYKDIWETISSGRTWQGRMVNKRKDGTTFTEVATISPVRNELNHIVSYVAVKRNITEQLQLEAQFQQAQKLESLGRLAGGVAHDYYNILSVIIGFAEMGLDGVKPDDPLSENLNEILKAAHRSKTVTRQLLAFARKDTIVPEITDLNASVEDMQKMIRRLIGEDIDLTRRPKEGLWPVRIDPSQIDQILANLCVNARDAITGVGKINIETGNVNFDAEYCSSHAEVVPGDFVMLTVSDDGCGMDKEVLDKIFEPFFTTKGIDKGTGLGLSTVYGICKQNNGFIKVYSEPGQGTTFRMYFPRYTGALPEKQAQHVDEIPKGKGEMILVVEDEASILRMAEKIFYKCGYQVLTANSPSEALKLAKTYTGEISLVITDVIMPEMNGRELSEKLTAIFPDLKCLFMSGYTADVIFQSRIVEEGLNFISKPFSAKDLAKKVSAVLNSSDT